MKLFKDIPETWDSVRLDGISEINPTNPDEPPADDQLASFVPMKRIEELTGNLDPSEEKAWGEIKSGYTRFQEGDIVIAKITPSMENGKAALARNLKNGVAAGTTELHVIRPSGTILPEYLLYFVLQEGFRREAESNMTGTAGHMRVPADFIESVDIPLPPYSEQERIVAKIEELLSKLRSGVSELEEVNHWLQRYRFAILKAAFEGELSSFERRREGFEPNGTYDTPDEIPDIITLPSEWRWAKADEVIKSLRNGIYKPKEYYVDDGIACLRMYNIEDGRIVWKDIKRMELTEDEREKYGLEVGDLLVNRVNSRELVGKTAPIPEGLEECVYESKNIRLRTNDCIRAEFLGYWFYLFRKHYFMSQVKQTVGQATVTQKQIKEMPVPLPPILEQDIIVEIIERQESIISDLHNQISANLKRSSRLRQAILKHAFKGKLVRQNSASESPIHSSETGNPNDETLEQKTLPEVTPDVE